MEPFSRCVSNVSLVISILFLHSYEFGRMWVISQNGKEASIIIVCFLETLRWIFLCYPVQITFPWSSYQLLIIPLKVWPGNESLRFSDVEGLQPVIGCHGKQPSRLYDHLHWNDITLCTPCIPYIPQYLGCSGLCLYLNHLQFWNDCFCLFLSKLMKLDLIQELCSQFCLFYQSMKMSRAPKFLVSRWSCTWGLFDRNAAFVIIWSTGILGELLRLEKRT